MCRCPARETGSPTSSTGWTTSPTTSGASQDQAGGGQPAGAQQGRVQRIEADLLALSQDLQQGNRTLREANESLRGAYNAKKDFLDRLSHELRTPLNTILGFGELLSLDGLSAEHREWITMTLQASRHLVQLMDEAGDVAQIEDRTLTLSMEAVPVHGLIADVIEMIRPLALAEGVQIDPPPRPAASQYIRADEQRFRQIMLNLLSNAVKYNYPGGRVTITVDDQPGDQLRVSVTDTGRGIAGQDVGRLFLPFERLDAAQAGVEGAGLGLALSRDLIEAMGGTTGVTSTQGEGSTFWIELAATEPVAVSQLAIERDVIVSSRAYSTAQDRPVRGGHGGELPAGRADPQAAAVDHPAARDAGRRRARPGPPAPPRPDPARPAAAGHAGGGSAAPAARRRPDPGHPRGHPQRGRDPAAHRPAPRGRRGGLPHQAHRRAQPAADRGPRPGGGAARAGHCGRRNAAARPVRRIFNAHYYR